MDNIKERKSQSNTRKIVIAVVAVLIVLAGVILFILPEILEKRRESLIEEKLSLGQKYLSEMDYENAAAAFSEVIKIDDKNMGAYFGLGKAYLELEKWPEATDSYNKVVSIDDKNTEAYIGLGDAYVGQEEWGSAVDGYDNAIGTIMDLVLADTPEIAEETLPDRKKILSAANLADSEYMTDDELRLIEALTGGKDKEESANQETTVAQNYTAGNTWNIIKKRNTAMKNDINELERTGGNTEKYSDYLSWFVTVTVQIVEPSIGIPIADAEVIYPNIENPALSPRKVITDSNGIAHFKARNKSTATLTISDSNHGERSVDIDVNTDLSEAEPVQIPLYGDISNVNAKVVEEWKEEFNGHTYCLIKPDSIVYWREALVICEELGGHLLTITSAEEKDFIIEYLSRQEIHKNIGSWPVNIGAYKIEGDDTWKWVTDEDASYLNKELAGIIRENYYADRDPLHIIKLQVANTGSEKEGYSLYDSWWEENTYNAIGFVIEWDT